MEKYLISIETSGSPRWQAFFSQDIFKQNRSAFHVFGVKGIDLPTQLYFKLAVANRERTLSPGELGCTLSHLEAIKHFLETDQQYAIFFEDDTIQKFDFSLDQLEQEIIKLKLKPNFLFSLGGIQLSFSEKVKGTFLTDKLFGKNVIAIHPYYYKNLSSTYAYMLDRQMAQVLIKYHQPPRGCDHWGELSSLENVPHLYATYLFDHPEISSTLTNSYIEKERIDLKESQNIEVKDNLMTRLLSKIKRLKLKSYIDSN
ncbi:glycosyltransferase family 25 protein [Acinetobacter terrestris]|uniref:glycosyltransferase family 25 protein n=1 Tax=Acinetobacter terrestris TaxID=2529843 RepID=UPI003526ADF3